VTAPASKNALLENQPVGLTAGKIVYQQEMRRVYENYQEIVEEDANSFERDSEIQYCNFKKNA
jgi:hypothetical protein